MTHPRGAALLEVLVALAILAIAGVTLLSALGESVQALERSLARDREISSASAFLNVVALWPREDLDRRLGWREQGRWRLRIDRPEPELYAVTLADSTGMRMLLTTVLYRPVPGDAR